MYIQYMMSWIRSAHSRNYFTLLQLILPFSKNDFQQPFNRLWVFPREKRWGSRENDVPSCSQITQKAGKQKKKITFIVDNHNLRRKLKWLQFSVDLSHPLLFSLQAGCQVCDCVNTAAVICQRLLCKPHIYKSYSILCRYIIAIVDVAVITRQRHTPWCLRK